mmetsp:Transcript_13603/g.42040  ORF Transcript_13603/g.42040 Transcript_13603/m.42040 type:complete len:224 (+) Transcript_13603:2132-2803(+)
MCNDDASPFLCPSSLKIAHAWFAACNASIQAPLSTCALATMRSAVASKSRAPSSRKSTNASLASWSASSGSSFARWAFAAPRIAAPLSFPGCSCDGMSMSACNSATLFRFVRCKSAAVARAPVSPHVTPTCWQSTSAPVMVSRQAAGPSWIIVAWACTQSSASIPHLSPAFCSDALAVDAFSAAAAAPPAATRCSAAAKSATASPHVMRRSRKSPISSADSWP